MNQLFDLQPQLENELLVLRPLMASDFENLYKVASDPLIWEQHPSKDRCQRDVFEVFFQEAIASRGAFSVIDKKKNQIIGSTRFQPVKETNNAIEIGWTFLAREYWGGYYNQCMKRLMIDYAFQFVSNVLFYIGAENMRSQRAVEKIGGERVNLLDGIIIEGRPNASVVYRIKKEHGESGSASQQLPGSIAALLGEYKKAIGELAATIRPLSADALSVTRDSNTSNPDCRSVQTILTHVVHSGYAYTNYIAKHVGSGGETYSKRLFKFAAEYIEELEKMFSYCETFFTWHPSLQLEETENTKKMVTSWGQHYDPEQLMEHAIVHVLKHRRQIQKFLGPGSR